MNRIPHTHVDADGVALPVPRWINRALAQGKTIVATCGADYQMRVVRVRMMGGTWYGRSTDGQWYALPCNVLFRVTP